MKKSLVTTALASAMFLATSLAPANAFDITKMNDSQRKALQGEIRKYLLENPEIIMEAVSVLEKKRATQREQDDRILVKTYEQALTGDPHSWVGGNKEGDVTVIEFVDYRCGYCRKAHDDVAALLKADKNIRLIVKELPILGENSVISSQFAIAVKLISGDKAYKAASEALIRLKPQPTDPVLRRLAGTLGLDADAIMKKMQSEEVAKIIQANRLLGRQLRINGTPTFVIGDEMVRGYVPMAAMAEIVDDARKK